MKRRALLYLACLTFAACGDNVAVEPDTAPSSDAAVAPDGAMSDSNDVLSKCEEVLIPSEPTEGIPELNWDVGFFGQGTRTFERYTLPCGTCGNGEPYQFFFSPPTSAAGAKRLVIYYQGGGSTLVEPDGTLNSAVRGIEDMRSRLYPQHKWWNVNGNLFMEHPATAAVVSDAAWVYVPYCTQDMHAGRRTEEVVYDFTGQLLHAEYQQLVDAEPTPPSIADLEAAHPGVRFSETHIEGSRLVIDKLELAIVHRGGLNAKRIADVILARMQQINASFLEQAHIVISGSSAGGYGTWYNLRHWVDPLKNNGQTQFTMIPIAGGPTAKAWDEQSADIVELPDVAAGLQHRLTTWDVERPCDVSGGQHVASGSDQCDDAIDLLDHYRLQRYPGQDGRYGLVINKEDLVVVSNIIGLCGATSGPCFEAALLNFCKTVHRYGQYMSVGRPDSAPFVMWQAYSKKAGGPPFRTHTPRYALTLQALTAPSGDGQTGLNMLEYIGRLVNRQPISVPQIEHMPTLVNDWYNTSINTSPISSHYQLMQSCNVPQPN